MKTAPTYRMRQFESQAQRIRRLAGVQPSVPIDAKEVAKNLGYEVVESSELFGGDGPTVDAGEFSGMALPDQNLIVINSSQTPQRKQSTIMEEVAHLLLQHEAEVLGTRDALNRNHFSDAIETEAYWVGSACLLPAQALAEAVFDRQSVSSISKDWGVSRELVEFRLKTLRLWKRADRKELSNVG